jgi:hypothetical protein
MHIDELYRAEQLRRVRDMARRGKEPDEIASALRGPQGLDANTANPVLVDEKQIAAVCAAVREEKNDAARARRVEDEKVLATRRRGTVEPTVEPTSPLILGLSPRRASDFLSRRLDSFPDYRGAPR